MQLLIVIDTIQVKGSIKKEESIITRNNIMLNQKEEQKKSKSLKQIMIEEVDINK